MSPIYLCFIYWRGGSVLELTPRNWHIKDNIKAKLLVSHRYVDTSNILVVQARFHRTSNTQQQSWEPLHGLRNNRASRRTRRSTASRIGGKIWFILCHSTLTSLHFSPTVPLGPLRGFTDDGETVSLARRKTARQKVNFLEVMRGQIANYCPVISRNTLLKNSTSIQSVWLPGFCKPTSGSWRTPWRLLPETNGLCGGHFTPC